MGTLYLEYWIEDEDFYIYAETEDDDMELTLEGQAQEIVKAFSKIYDIIEEKQSDRAQEMLSLLKNLSQRLIEPLEGMLENCDMVRFVVDEDLLRCAFDLLLTNGDYLFLQKPVCYQIVEGEGDDEPEIDLESALLIADLEADPEEACKQVSEMLDDAQYAEVKDASLKMIKNAASEVDVLVVSAHGEMEEATRGAIYLDDETVISAKVMGSMEAWLVYCDSCQQGINMDYLEAFQEDSDIQFYLAPIISNDAGDSSTYTMVWFFEQALEDGNPIRALFETRKRLYDLYARKQALDAVTVLNKAFAFRLYEMVEEEEGDDEDEEEDADDEE